VSSRTVKNFDYLAGRWRVRLLFRHHQILDKDYILLLTANIDNVIVKGYESVNYIGIAMEYQKYLPVVRDDQ
jgi:hypothetical protein